MIVAGRIVEVSFVDAAGRGCGNASKAIGGVEEAAAGEIYLLGLAVQPVIAGRIRERGGVAAAVAEGVNGGESCNAADEPLIAKLALVRLTDERLVAGCAPQIRNVLPAGRREGLDGVELGRKGEPAGARNVAAVVVGLEGVVAG